MLKIKRTNPQCGADYELENGDLLYTIDWNGERYEISDGTYWRPVYAEEENGNGGFDIVGFKKW